MNDNTMTHSPGCTRPDPWRDRFKPGWIRLKCPECQHIANVTEAALFNQDNAKALTPTPTSGYRCGVCCSHRTVTQEGRISPEEEGSSCRNTVSSPRSTATKRC